MMLLKQALFLAILAAITTPDAIKMVIIFGAPQTFSTFTSFSMDFASCVDYCYDTDSCMAVYSPENGTDYCQVYGIGELSTVQEADEGGKVAMRMNDTDSTGCPLTAGENSMKTATTVGQYNITNSNGVWKFTTLVCPNSNFTMFQRPLGLWCIGVIQTPTIITQTQGASYCSSQYAGVLSGLQSLDEYNSIIGLVQPILASITGTLKSFGTLGFWINGARKSTCSMTVTSASCNGTNEFTFSDPLLSAYDGYVWGVNQPSGIGAADSNCIHFGFNSSTYSSLGVDDYKCTVTNSSTTAFIGYICGVLPTAG